MFEEMKKKKKKKFDLSTKIGSDLSIGTKMNFGDNLWSRSSIPSFIEIF